MIRTFADATTEDIWNGVNSKAARHVSKSLWPAIRRKLDDRLSFEGGGPTPTTGQSIACLKDDFVGYHAIRVNDQYRIVFRFDGRDAFEVRCTDYH